MAAVVDIRTERFQAGRELMVEADLVVVPHHHLHGAQHDVVAGAAAGHGSGHVGKPEGVHGQDRLGDLAPLAEGNLVVREWVAPPGHPGEGP